MTAAATKAIRVESNRGLLASKHLVVVEGMGKRVEGVLQGVVREVEAVVKGVEVMESWVEVGEGVRAVEGKEHWVEVDEVVEG